MNQLDGVKAGDKIVKILSIRGIETASIAKISAVCKKRGLVSTDEYISKAKDIQDDGVQTYRMDTGRANVNYIDGSSTRLVVMEE